MKNVKLKPAAKPAAEQGGSGGTSNTNKAEAAHKRGRPAKNTLTTIQEEPGSGQGGAAAEKGTSEGHFSSSAAEKISSMPHAVGRVRLDPALRSERLAEREAQEAPDGGYDEVQSLSCKGGALEKGTARRQTDGTYQITYASRRAEAGLSFRTIKGRAVQPAS